MNLSTSTYTKMDKKKEIREYFDNVSKYFKADINSLRNIDLKNNRIGLCGTPQLLLLISVMENFGYLLSGINATEQRIYFFIKNYIDEIEDWQSFFYRVIRNGVTHQFFMKNYVTLAKYQNHETHSNKVFCKDHINGNLVLNINALTDIVENTIDDKVKNKFYTDETDTIDLIYSNLLRMREDDKAHYDKNLKNKKMAGLDQCKTISVTVPK